MNCANVTSTGSEGSDRRALSLVIVPQYITRMALTLNGHRLLWGVSGVFVSIAPVF